MSSVGNVGGNSPVRNINPVYTRPVGKPEGAAGSAPARGADKLELSATSQFLQTLKAGGDVRADKVARIKSQIADGSYEDGHKLDVAVDKLLDDLFK